MQSHYSPSKAVHSPHRSSYVHSKGTIWNLFPYGQFARAIAILALLFAPTISRTLGADGFWLMSTSLGLPDSRSWRPYNGGDAPEGGYMGWLWNGSASLSGSIPLGRTLSPGTYFVMAKLIDYDGKPGRISFQLGDSTGSTVVENRDWNKYWTTPTRLQTTSATDSLTLNLLRTASSTVDQKYLVLGVYITTNANENVPLYGFDRIVNYTHSTNNSPSLFRSGNILPDASFETGFSHGWGYLAEVHARLNSVQALWITNSPTVRAFDGSACLYVTDKGILVSRVLNVQPNKRYTLSAWVRSPTARGIGMGVYNINTPPPGFPPVVNLFDGSFSVTPEWTRIQLSGLLLNYPNTDYQIVISANPDTYIDAVQLEEGDLSPFRPAATVEFGFQSDKPGRLLFEDESPSIELIAANSTTTIESRLLQYDIIDIFNRTILSGQIQLNLGPMARSTQRLSLPNTRGIFRIVAWIKDQPNSIEEITYAVLPRPRNPGVDEESSIGVHPNLMPFQLSMHQRLGIKWGRALSPESIFRWGRIEPVEGQIRREDGKVDRAPQFGMTILGTIGTNFEWPAWADRNGLPDLDKWESFVERLVTIYRGRVKYWEIWNEPIYNFTPQFYAELLKRASFAIRRADPSAKIVGMGGVYSKDWILNVLSILGDNWRQHLDIISTHLYPPGTDPSGGETESRAVAFKRDVVDKFNVEVWNTETGVWDEGFYKGPNSSFSPLGDAIWPHFDSERYVRGSFYEPERLLANMFHCLGNGLNKYFYYDSRIYNNPSYQKSHPTFLEFDDSIRSKGVAYGIAAWFLDSSRGLGDILNAPTLFTYLFDNSGVATVVVWPKTKQNHTLQLPGSGWRAFDLMGNPVTNLNGLIPLGRTPVYIRSDNLNTDGVRAAFQAAVIRPVDDRVAPQVTIDYWPTGPEVQDPVRIRWLGIDDLSIPSATDPSAVTYSYILEGYSSAWSGWSPGTTATFSGLLEGSYVFKVRARDEAGNISEIADVPIIKRQASPPSSPANARRSN